MRLIASAAAVLMVGACSGGASAPAPDEHPVAADEARSSLARETAPAVADADRKAAVAGNNAFAFALHRQLVEPGKNLMSSPYSVSTALAMTYAGARGETASQMAQVLHFTLPQEKLHPAFNAIDLALQKPLTCGAEACAPFTLRLANAAWAQKGYPFESAYLDTLASNYGAGVKLVDFAGAAEPARIAVNDWVADATEQKIKDLLPEGSVDALTRLVLTNAVYFKGNWQTQFQEGATGSKPFHLLNGEIASIPTMQGVLDAKGAAEADYDAVELAYRDSHFAMLVVAPKVGTFEAFESAFDAEALEGVLAALDSQVVTLSLPKFKFEWKKSLVTPLSKLGMVDAFNVMKADLTAIASTGELYVGDVIHQTFIAVDEKGTEAAAATAVIIPGRGLPGSPNIVSIDRPFLFAIRDTVTAQIVFLGRVVDPR